MKEVRCKTCIHKFSCLAYHYIPENLGYDCIQYVKVAETRQEE